MSIKTILSRCDVLPGDFILLSEYQEQGILSLEEWHFNHQQNIVTELISSGYLDTDYPSSDSSFDTDYSSDDDDDDDTGYQCDGGGEEEYECDKVMEIEYNNNPNSNVISSSEDDDTECDVSERQSLEITDSETTVDDDNNYNDNGINMGENNSNAFSMFINIEQLQQEISLFGDGKINKHTYCDDEETSISDSDYCNGNDSETSIDEDEREFGFDNILIPGNDNYLKCNNDGLLRMHQQRFGFPEQSTQRKPLSALINNIIQYNVSMNDGKICTFEDKYRY
mmetsp:Transcript_72026/g.64719  ORF Transcript_72026/g.64719 Transcript_72026/m.64719 type:complete len:282 (-) Transcript_72026:104-949(-)